jgi:hypothetical protein
MMRWREFPRELAKGHEFLSKVTRVGRFPPLVKKRKFDIPDGIIAHLTRECGGNVHDRNIVAVTCGSFEKETCDQYRAFWAGDLLMDLQCEPPISGSIPVRTLSVRVNGIFFFTVAGIQRVCFQATCNDPNFSAGWRRPRQPTVACDARCQMPCAIAFD